MQQYLDPKSSVVTRSSIPQKLQFTSFHGLALRRQDPEQETPNLFLHVVHNWAFLSSELHTYEGRKRKVCKSRGGCCLRKTLLCHCLPTSCWVSPGAGAHGLPCCCLCLAGGSPWVPPAALLGGATFRLSVAGTMGCQVLNAPPTARCHPLTPRACEAGGLGWRLARQQKEKAPSVLRIFSRGKAEPR